MLQNGVSAVLAHPIGVMVCWRIGGESRRRGAEDCNSSKGYQAFKRHGTLLLSAIGRSKASGLATTGILAAIKSSRSQSQSA
jgi:hypothetical protein